jgi:hypothetical protein
VYILVVCLQRHACKRAVEPRLCCPWHSNKAKSAYQLDTALMVLHSSDHERGAPIIVSVLQDGAVKVRRPGGELLKDALQVSQDNNITMSCDTLYGCTEPATSLWCSNPYRQGMTSVCTHLQGLRVSFVNCLVDPTDSSIKHGNAQT